MGHSEDGWEFASPSVRVRNVVLVGRTGNGKSATGNSILGKKEFKSKLSSGGVTSTCELKTTYLGDGQILNVIDTPGLFDCSGDTDYIGKEIVKCINMAKDGIHAVLMVFSVKARFSVEEATAFRSLQTLFGEKINDYMIVVFTGGDELEDSDETLEDYLGRDCPEPLKEIVHMCGNRKVLFDNKTQDGAKKAEQQQELLSHVNAVLSQNGGQPYTDKIFAEVKGAMKIRDQAEEGSSLEGQLHKAYEEYLERIILEIESKLKRLELQLAEDRAARLEAEKIAEDAKKKSNDKICQLREDLDRAKLENEEIRKKNGCIIL